VLGWNELTTILVMGLSTTLYTMFGGVQAVTWTDVKQMIIIFVGLFVALVVIVGQFPAGVSIGDAMSLAGAAGRMKAVDTSFKLNETYTLWSGLIGGMFLALSYFGCDQSQVQRFLTARSVSEGRTSLLMSAFVKIPMQVLILFIGVMVFVFYQFVQPPLVFKSDDRAKVEQRVEYQQLNSEYAQAFAARQQAALDFANAENQGDAARQSFLAANTQMNDIRKRAGDLVRGETGKPFNDVNYVFPTFVTTYAPVGVIGLIIAAIFAAAMSSISAELTSLSTATVIDFYRRHFRKEASDAHYLMVSKLATGFWGIFACVVAMYAGRLGSLIEVVNKFGSYFYGSLLGVFVLAIGTRRATGNGAFFGLLAGIVSVALVGNYSLVSSWLRTVTGIDLVALIGDYSKISFLWYNVVGCVIVIAIGMTISLTEGKRGNK
jgi:Na+/proline symporter